MTMGTFTRPIRTYSGVSRPTAFTFFGVFFLWEWWHCLTYLSISNICGKVKNIWGGGSNLQGIQPSTVRCAILCVTHDGVKRYCYCYLVCMGYLTRYRS